MHRPMILYLALLGALFALAAMTVAVRGAAVVVPGTDAVALTKKTSGDGKVGYAKDDGVMHVDLVRRAIGRDEIHAKKVFAKDGDDARKGKTSKDARQGDIKKDSAKDEGEARMVPSKTGAEKKYSRSGKGDFKSDKGDFKTDKGTNRGDLKEDLAKDDGKLRVDRIRRAVRSDEIHAKKAFAKDGDVTHKDRFKDDDVAHKDRIKGKTGKGANRDDLEENRAKDDDVARVDRIKTGRPNAWSKADE